MPYTEDQERAIETNGTVLVLAGAGSGKTGVMVERCLRNLFDPDPPADLDEILMVTFTETAAAEMKGRIAEELNRRYLQADPSTKRRIKEQLALLDTAYIGTLHSIALRLIREYHHHLQLPPGLRIISQAERAMLVQQALSDTLREHYREESPPNSGVQRWIRQVGNASDRSARQLIAELHQYLQTLPEPQQWLNRQYAFYQPTEPNGWFDWLRRDLQTWIEHWHPALQAEESDCANLAPCRKTLEALRQSLSETPFRNFDLSPILEADGSWPKGNKTRIRPLFEAFFADTEFLATLLKPDTSPTEELPLQQDWYRCRQWIDHLLQLTQEFGQRFDDLKRRNNFLDFQDIEQFALKLLRSPAPEEPQRIQPAESRPFDPTGPAPPSPVACHLQNQFRYLFVDEYQDINRAQHAIIHALVRPGERSNLFLVGDIKQSIYGFRLASPEILQHYEKERPADAGPLSVVHLQKNFRSHPRLISFFNDFFTTVAARVPGFGYAGGDQLAPREADPVDETNDRRVEFHLSVPPSPSELSAREFEVHAIAQRIRAILDEGTELFDARTGSRQPATYASFAVLLRAVENRTPIFSRIFAQYQIPVQAADSAFFELTEIKDLIALLQTIDNPIDDIPLLTVLRSPFFGFVPNELAVIRLVQKRTRFWQALQVFHDQPYGDDSRLKDWRGREPETCETWVSRTREKCARFLTQYERWHLASRTHPPAECLELILAETGYPEYAGRTNEHARFRIRQFVNLVREFETNHVPSLAQLVRWLTELQESNHQIEPVKKTGQDAVQLMSVHKSKGLQFPIVILAHLDNRFNLDDLKKSLLLDRDCGPCPLLSLPETFEAYPSLPLWLGRRNRRNQLVEEEARLLYVAMTRAQDRLILSGTATQKKLDESWLDHSARQAAGRPLKPAASWLDWIGPWMSQHTGLNQADRGDRDGIYWNVCRESDDFQERQQPAAARNESPPLADIEQLLDRIDRQYPYLAATLQRATASATALNFAHRRPAYPKPQRPDAASKPAKGRTRNAISRGLTYHQLLQLLDPRECTSRDRVQQAAARLVELGSLKDVELETVELDPIVAFWTSEVGTAIRGKEQHQLRRELPFTMRLTIGELTKIGFDFPAGPQTVEEPLIVRGIVDLAVIEPESIWLLDFKSDDLAEEEIPERTDHHSAQLSLYRQALQDIYHRRVTRTWIHFLVPSRTVELSGD